MSRVIFSVLALGVFLSSPASGEDQPLPSVARHPNHHDVSPPLRDIPPARRPAGPPHEAPEPGKLPPKPRSAAPDPVTQIWNGPLAIPSASRDFEGIGQGFTGPQGTFSVNSAPPDTDGDVGPNHYVQIVNTDFAVFNRSGTVLYGPVPTNTLWAGFGGACETKNDGDAVVKYDKRADRWIFEQPVFETPYMECLAISTSGDPTGSYNRYSYTFTDFPDYPKMSVWPDGYYITYNMFNGNNFVGGEVCGYDRAAMISGGAATQQCFSPVSAMGGSVPSDVDGPTDPPAGSANYVLTFGTNSLLIWKAHIDWNNSALSSLTGPTTLSAAAFNEACGGGTCIPQPGTTNPLDSLADRLMMRLAYRNFGDHEALVVNHSVTPSGSGVGVSGVRWYEIRSPGSSPSIFQQGTFAPADGSSRWMGSAAMDGSGDIAVGYSISSGTVFPSISYTGRLVGDPPGTLPQGESSIQAGGGSQTKIKGVAALTRWGDYSALAVDPVDDCTFWYTDEYLAATGAFNWHTRIASFKFPNCGCATTPTAAASGSKAICAGSSTLLLGSGGTSCSWSPATGLSNPASCTPTASPSSTTTYSLTVADALGCVSTNTSTVTVTVDPKPSPPAISAPSSVQPGATGLTASVASHAGSTYAWSISDGSITAGNGTSQITFTAGVTGTLTLQVVETGANGCASAAGSVNVTVGSPPPPPQTSFYTLTPCRVADTRNTTGPYGGPALSAGSTRTFVLAGQCGIPADAKAVSVNITVTQATSDGTLKLNPAGVIPSAATAISFAAGQTLANNAMTFLGTGGAVSVENDQLSGTTEFIADVNGYFK